jgi:hypothetical protein
MIYAEQNWIFSAIVSSTSVNVNTVTLNTKHSLRCTHNFIITRFLLKNIRSSLLKGRTEAVMYLWHLIDPIIYIEMKSLLKIDFFFVKIHFINAHKRKIKIKLTPLQTVQSIINYFECIDLFSFYETKFS